MTGILRIIVSAFVGLYLGAITALCIYVGIIKRRIRKKGGVKFSDNIPEDKRKEVEEIIKKHYKNFNDGMKGSLKRKIFAVKKKPTVRVKKLDYYALVYDVARVFRPTAYQPLLDISEEQLFLFLHTVINRVREVADASGVEPIKTLKLSTVLDTEKLITAVLGHKAVKTASKLFSVIIRILNFFNPYFWIRQVAVSVPLIGTLKEIVRYSIIIPAVEFANLYAGISAEKEQSESTQSKQQTEKTAV